MSRRNGSGNGKRDGRYIDSTTGLLLGEGSQQDVQEAEERLEQIARDAWNHVPSMPAHDGSRSNETYYDRPAIKEPVWKWYVPAYFYAGGVSGAAAVLGAAAQTLGRGRMRGLVKRSRWLAAVGGAAGTAFLVADLGRPERFLNMLRVFRPTSPMSVGSFVLSTETPLAAGAALLGHAERGAPRVLGDLAGLGAGVMGLPMSSYTSVLVTNSAIPVWQAMGRTLPAAFAASAATSATSLLDLMHLEPQEEAAVSRLGTAAKIAELLAATAVDKEASSVERVGKPLQEGMSGSLWKASKACTAASLAIGVLPGRRRWKRATAGLLGTAGAVAMRFAIWQAGYASARDPRATFEQQRAGKGGASVASAESREPVRI
jgi:hypothetical protein